MAQHRACGGEVHLLTLTAPHTRFDVLEELQAKLGKALNGFLADKTVKKTFKEMGYIGQIRGYEVTHGRKGLNNGWHPHFHFLQFVQVKGDAAQLMDWKTRLYLRWDAYCQKAGLGSPSFQHGIDLRDGSFADRYISKGVWGLEDEMTKGTSRREKQVKRLMTCSAQSWPIRTTSKQWLCLPSSPRLSGQAAVVLVEWVEGPIWPGR